MQKDIIFSPQNLNTLLIDRKPSATAKLFTKDALKGTVSLYATPIGVLVKADFDGLPRPEGERGYRVLFVGNRRRSSLPCAYDGTCHCLTSSFSIEDVLGSRVTLLSGSEFPIASGELRAAGA